MATATITRNESVSLHRSGAAADGSLLGISDAYRKHLSPTFDWTPCSRCRPTPAQLDSYSGIPSTQRFSNCRELGQSRLKVLDDLSGNHFGRRQVVGIF